MGCQQDSSEAKGIEMADREKGLYGVENAARRTERGMREAGCSEATVKRVVAEQVRKGNQQVRNTVGLD